LHGRHRFPIFDSDDAKHARKNGPENGIRETGDAEVSIGCGSNTREVDVVEVISIISQIDNTCVCLAFDLGLDIVLP